MNQRKQSIFVHIVDDDESIRRGLSRLMRSVGYSSCTYDSAELFLATAHPESPACLLMDITMPRMNGLELAKQLAERGINLPVIAISARDDKDTLQLIRDLGVEFFLRKPVDDQALVDAINWVTRRDGGDPPD